MSIAKIVEEFMPCCAVRGHEEPYLKAIGKRLEPVGEVEVTHLYALCRIKGRRTGKKRLILAQGTTPGYQAGEIKENGSVRMHPIDDAGCRTPLTWIEPFKPVDAETFSKRVTIYGDQTIDAVVPAPPVHYQTSVGKLAKADGLYAVSGYTKQQLEQIVHPGDAVTYTPYLQKMLNGKFFAPFLAYRIAPAAVVALSEALIQTPPEYDVVLAVTGGSHFSGAVRVTEQEKPDELIILTAAAEKSYKGDGVESGEHINQCFGSAVNYPYSEQLERYFAARGYVTSRLASLVNTNTPADECTYLGQGIPTAMFAVPVKYTESSVSAAKESEAAYLTNALADYLTQEQEG